MLMMHMMTTIDENTPKNSPYISIFRILSVATMKQYQASTHIFRHFQPKQSEQTQKTASNVQLNQAQSDQLTATLLIRVTQT